VGQIVGTDRALGTGALVCGADNQRRPRRLSESVAKAQFVGATLA